MNSENNLSQLELSEQEAALAAALLEIVRHASVETALPSAPGSQIGRFALFHTDSLVEKRPELKDILGPETLAQSAGDQFHLTAVESPTSETEIAEELAEASWPEGLSGGIVCGNIRAAAHEQPTDDASGQVFAAVGALLSGETFCAVRQTGAHQLQLGRTAVPELVASLQASLGIALIGS